MELLASLLPSILLLVLLSSAIFILFNSKKSSDGLRTYPVVGNLPQFIRNLHRMLEWSTELLAASQTGTVTLSPFLVLTVNPANVEYVAKSNFGNYPKGVLPTTALHDFLGNGILNVNGEQWKQQRKTASYQFNTASLRAFVLNKVRYEIDHRLLPLLRDSSSKKSAVDLQEVLERFAFDNICGLVFGEDPDCLYGKGSEWGEKFFYAFDEATRLSVHRAMLPFSVLWKIKKLLKTGSERRLRDSMVTVHELIEGFIRSRRASKSKSNDKDFLSRFMEDGSHSDELIRDILISFVLAGRDTTPSALTWFFWLASSRPEIVEKIREEVRSVRASRNVEAFTLDELRRMNYLHAALSESLRLYPPVPLLPKESKADDVLPDGTPVRKGWSVMYSSYAMARMKKIWGDDCEEFKPERWLDEEGIFKPRNVFEYPVFHAGPRVCLGKDMAYIQMKAVAASIFEDFEMVVVEDRGEPELGMTLRMKGGLPITVREREKGAVKVSNYLGFRM